MHVPSQSVLPLGESFHEMPEDDDAENQMKKIQYEPKADYYFLCIKAIIIFVLTITMVPFIVCDFYYSLHKPYSCQLDKSKFMTSLRLDVWLMVSAIGTSITYVSIFCILACVPLTKEVKLTKAEDFYSKLLLLNRYVCLIWLIVGAVLFWRDIEPQQNCSKSFTNYIYAKLILGFISFFFLERKAAELS